MNNPLPRSIAQSSQTLTHLNHKGEAKMVDVSKKDNTQRVAIARGCIRMQPTTLQSILNHTHHKGDVLAVARIAGIMAAKRTSEWIPLCHPIALTSIDIKLTPYASPEWANRIPHYPEIKTSACLEEIKKENEAEAGMVCRATARTVNQTGVEMEALTAVSAALLTLYDMCKAVDRFMELTDISLLEKHGGKSGTWRNPKYLSDQKTIHKPPLK